MDEGFARAPERAGREAAAVYGVSAAILAGVALRSFVPFGGPVMACVLLAAGCLVLASLAARRRAWMTLAAVFLIALSLGMWRMDAASHLSDPALDRALGQQVALEGVISADADRRESSTLLSVRADALVMGGATTSISATVLAVADPYAQGAYGDRVRIEGQLALPEAFDTDTGRQFDYPGYLAAQGIAYEVMGPAITVISHGHGNGIMAWLLALKHGYLSGLTRALPLPESALAGGITAGDKRALGKELLADFRTAGIVHIVVLSGYNVTIIAESVMAILGFLPRAFGITAGALGIAAFAAMTGGSASIVRASIMAVLALVAQAIRRPYAILRALVLTVVGMVLWNPFILIHDPGFQLSVIATLGLIFVTPLLVERMGWLTERFGIREIVGATLGTQLSVLPLLLWQMGTLSLVALPVNVLVLAVVPAAMLLSALAALAGILLPWLAPMLGLPAYVLLAYMLAIVHASVSVPFAALAVPPFPAPVMLLSYAGLIALLVAVHRKRIAAASVKEAAAALSGDLLTGLSPVTTGAETGGEAQA
ncbi:MAG TPA: ComEC/Rec2 family competence protein [Candidatus Paceibacterota bacterium]|nr:ComEC/Rec2 family competence protein [Candidatus Paceibacterota bacterium]